MLPAQVNAKHHKRGPYVPEEVSSQVVSAGVMERGLDGCKYILRWRCCALRAQLVYLKIGLQDPSMQTILYPLPTTQSPS